MFNETDYEKEMELDPFTIYVDTRERERVLSFHKYMHTQNHVQDNGMYRITTSNGEYFYYKEFMETSLPKGDFFYNGVAFEYKTLKDLELSIYNSERLNQQIDNVLKDPSIDNYIIICNCLSNFNFQESKVDRERFENLKNFFNQFIPFHIHFIPTTSEKIAFRDMINIWRCSKSPNNLYTLNKKYPLNPFLSNLTLLPSINHNNATAIFKEYPYTLPEDMRKLTEEMVADVKFGKKRCGEAKAKKIIRQRDILFPSKNTVDLKNHINYTDIKIW